MTTQLPNIVVQLVHIEGPLKGEIQELFDPEISIGRLPHCQVLFPVDFAIVSRNHARIVREGNRYRIIDSSTNGTFVNGKRVTDTFLKSGDVITFAEGGPKVSFLTRIGADQSQPPKMSPPDTGAKPKVELGGTVEVPISKIQMPLVIQYGPTLRSFRELPITIGRAPECEFNLDHPEIRDHHAQFFFSQGRYWVKDMTGRNMISLDGLPIETQAPLNPGNILTLCPDGPIFRFLGGGRLAEYEEQ
ncbi:MAG: FHA domain-containing protein [Deltaproteobacteria bacterium]|nr:FHA domain-containing protein [Deltaproteobacteria bacterium]